MRIAQMANAWTIATVLSLTTVLVHSDSSVQPAPFHVVYLGRISALEDRVFQHFETELARLPPELRQRMRIHHIPALLRVDARIEEAVTQALAMKPALIVAPSTATALALRRRHSAVPVVFTS